MIRRIAVAVTGALVLGTTAFGALGLTTANAYGPTNTTLKCWVRDNTSPGDISTTAATWPDGTAGHADNGMALTLAAGPYTTGTPISVTLAFSQGPKNGPFAVAAEVFAVTYRIKQASGADLLIVGANSAPYAVGANEYGPAATVTNSITPTVAGATTVSVNTINFNATTLGLNVTTACNSQTSQVATPGANPFTTPVVTPIANSITVAAGTSTATPTTTTPAPTTTTPAPTTTTPAPTTTSPAPTGTPVPGVSGTLSCTTLTSVVPWTTKWSASVTGTKLNVAFELGPKTGPIPITPGELQALGTITVGAASVSVSATPYGALGPRTNVPGTTMSGTVSGAPTSVTVSKVVFKDGGPARVDTTCIPTATPIVLTIVSAPELPPTLPTSNGAATVTGSTVAGGTVTLSGSGFAPGSAFTAGMYSAPTTLGVGTASATGAASLDVTIPSALTGSHTMVLYGKTTAGAPFALTKTVTVTAASSSPTPTDTSTSGETNSGTLPKTGADSSVMSLVWALIALQIGLVFVVRTARSRRGSTRPVGAHARRH